jgi:hypothetical protein
MDKVQADPLSILVPPDDLTLHEARAFLLVAGHLDDMHQAAHGIGRSVQLEGLTRAEAVRVLVRAAGAVGFPPLDIFGPDPEAAVFEVLRKHEAS